MKKIYYANVALKVKDYFENKLRDHTATVLSRSLVINSNNNEQIYCYVIEAEEGIINPKWELKAQ